MSRPAHYSPAIAPHLVKVLYHEARLRRLRMTRLVNQLLTDALRHTHGWTLAAAERELASFNSASAASASASPPPNPKPNPHP